ncbi:putative baseplate assembly protein [Romeria aff. gracilis LEGE 07310]|uniref:Putative baseplate assembly protein n=1 Tax=Vasconcelosia minhoensis LEGE 07310 TaxID=915328 RepID=A0A8J7ALP9_9CYAN|nr:putative baseplate assembly protein [Romeria gracilis]MBE9080233.1 putative baseplate assembly protein [Romeria aff. gracilis LEGE 07310]
MEFDFLPKLPNSNLDDRTFKELVEECLLRVPRYCPEWTNHNPSDPGITMVELFGWLTDQMMMRFNQVPRRNYVAFLELLGIRLQPPAPARTEVTFYLAASLPSPYEIPAAVEVATERTETTEAIVFSTDRPLTIGLPRIHHLLTADTAERIPNVLQDRLSTHWNRQSDGRWAGREQAIFNPRPQPGNSFYLGLDPEQALAGNVIALSFEGETATPTGIRPEAPPRRWEAWDGQGWVPVLMQESDDETRGFSFYDSGSSSDVQKGEVVLHLPQQLPVTEFASYRGRWLRCVCISPALGTPAYTGSPQLLSVAARAIGGTIDASQCTLIQDEPLGESSGQPGQSFQLQSQPVLPRSEAEQLVVILPTGTQQTWHEVSDFADSGPEDCHYTIDSLTGTVQFGPLIREPGQLKTATLARSQQQSHGTAVLTATPQLLERQYGAIPPRGALITMRAYRTGGGQRGNVQPHTLRVIKSAVPYVASVINHGPASHGADAESLDDAVLRVPRLLRTRDRAVTPEDFETLAIEASYGAVARSICPRQINHQPGVVTVMLVPQANLASIETANGIPPAALDLTPQLTQQVLNFLDERRPLGLQVKLQAPDYIGVSVKTEVAIDPAYGSPEAQQAILHNLQVALYRFLNPLIGGRDGRGWPFGTPVYPSDIITLLQGITGVRYLGAVMLYEVRRQGTDWVRQLAPDNVVKPGALGLVCSWADAQLRSGHTISLIR